MFKQAKIKDIAELAIVKLHGKEATKPVSLFIVQGVQKSHKTYGVRPHRLSAFASAPDGDGPSTPSLPPLTVGPSAGSGGRLFPLQSRSLCRRKRSTTPRGAERDKREDLRHFLGRCCSARPRPAKTSQPDDQNFMYFSPLFVLFSHDIWRRILWPSPPQKVST